MKPDSVQDTERGRTRHQRTYVYRGTLPPALALLFVAPLLFLFLSFAAVLLAGGALTALFLLLVLRRASRRGPDHESIELGRDQYSRIEPDVRKLPERDAE